MESNYQHVFNNEPGGHVTYETPCSCEDNNVERCYPAKSLMIAKRFRGDAFRL